MTTIKFNRIYRSHKRLLKLIAIILGLAIIAAGITIWVQGPPSDKYYKGYEPKGILNEVDPAFKNGISFRTAMFDEVQSQCEVSSKTTDNFVYIDLNDKPSRFAELKASVAGKGYNSTYSATGRASLNLDCKLDFNKLEKVATTYSTEIGIPSAKQLEDGEFIFSVKDESSKDITKVLLFTINSSYDINKGADELNLQPEDLTLSGYTVYTNAIIIQRNSSLANTPNTKELNDYQHQIESK